MMCLVFNLFTFAVLLIPDIQLREFAEWQDMDGKKKAYKRKKKAIQDSERSVKKQQTTATNKKNANEIEMFSKTKELQTDGADDSEQKKRAGLDGGCQNVHLCLGDHTLQEHSDTAPV
jgi:hypothetical protein